MCPQVLKTASAPRFMRPRVSSGSRDREHPQVLETAIVPRFSRPRLSPGSRDRDCPQVFETTSVLDTLVLVGDGVGVDLALSPASRLGPLPTSAFLAQ